MKIIFLDIDGVMNCEVDWVKEERYDISKRCMGLLNDLIENTDAKVVISSTWRNKGIKNLKKIFKEKGFKGEIIDVTPHLNRDCLRGNEILRWMKDNPKIIGHYHSYYTYVIFDDDSDMLLWQGENFLPVDSYSGLTKSLIYRAGRILNR